VLESVRVRLALWHTAVVAAVLVAFAAATYTYLARSTLGRMDELLGEAARAFVVQLHGEADEGPTPRGAAAEAAATFRLGEMRVLVLGAGGRVLAAGPAASGAPRFLPQEVARALARRRGPLGTAFTFADGGGPERVFATGTRLGGMTLTVVTIQPMGERRAALERVRRAFLLAIPVALLLAGAGGYLLARRSLAPVVSMSALAERIGTGNLHERLPVPNPRDELGHLATVFNGLLSRLSSAIEQQRRFMADAAHELRTPVAIVRGETELALSRRERTPEEYRDALTVVHDEGRRLSRVVDDLFLLARADAGQQPLQPAELYLSELAAECARAMRTLAEARGITLKVKADHDAPFRGDEGLLHRLVINLLDNAVKYGPEGAEVVLEVGRAGGQWRLAVCDHGPAIPPEVRGSLFERFYRADRARARTAASATGGAGLGLSIAQWIVHSHGGTLRLESSRGRGNEFVVLLPAEEDAAAPAAGHAERAAAPTAG
jgi:heavy metal sensor kinase